MKKITLLILGVLLIAGCGSKPKVVAKPNFVSDKSIYVEVFDERPYVKDGDKKPSYLGYQTGTVGIHFEKYTSGLVPVAKRVKLEIESYLAVAGATILDIKPQKGHKTLVITIYELKGTTDYQIFGIGPITVVYSVKADIISPSGNIVASEKMEGSEIAEASYTIGQVIEEKHNLIITRLVSSDSIKKELSKDGVL